MKKIKVTRWGTSKLQCIKAVKDLMGLTLREAKDVIDSKLPYVTEVPDNENLETFINYVQAYCFDMEYTIEDSTKAVDITKHRTSRASIVENFVNAINNGKAAFDDAHTALDELIKQNDEIGDRYNKVCSEATLLQAEVERLKANDNNDLCIQLREEIARLKSENKILRENKKIVEANNDGLMIEIKSLQDEVQRLNAILRTIKELTL